jgi:chromosome segregation ATPase
LAASGEAEQLSVQSAQLRAALDDSSRQWDAERQELSQGNSVLEERRALLEAELTEATARHATATEDVRRLADQLVQLRSAYDDAERRIAEQRELFLQQQHKLEAALGESRAHTAAIEAQAQGWEQTIRTLQDATAQRTADWEAERLVSQTAARALEDDKQRLQMEVANTQAVLVTAHEHIADLRGTLVRRAAEWDGERWVLQEAAQTLENDKRQLRAEVLKAGEDLAEAHGQLSELRRRLSSADNHAAWSALQIAELVEKDAAAAGDLAQRREEVDGFVAAAKRLLAVDELPSTDLLAVLGHLRQHLRETERELDRAEAERDRIRAVLDTAAGRRHWLDIAGLLRRLFPRLRNRGEKLNQLEARL